mmetsp:Transcript_6524/g.8960  ORF Transcript_6524/g.8960 Transcript_6524/m.8960 type:complete len:113 (+) Transcript_6524:262-600(+)
MGKSTCLALLLAAAVFTCSHGEDDEINTDAPFVPGMQANEPDPDCNPGDQCVMDHLSGTPKLPEATHRGVCVIGPSGTNECWDVCNQMNSAASYTVILWLVLGVAGVPALLN